MLIVDPPPPEINNRHKVLTSILSMSIINPLYQSIPQDWWLMQSVDCQSSPCQSSICYPPAQINDWCQVLIIGPLSSLCQSTTPVHPGLMINAVLIITPLCRLSIWPPPNDRHKNCCRKMITLSGTVPNVKFFYVQMTWLTLKRVKVCAFDHHWSFENERHELPVLYLAKRLDQWYEYQTQLS